MKTERREYCPSVVAVIIGEKQDTPRVTFPFGPWHDGLYFGINAFFLWSNTNVARQTPPLGTNVAGWLALSRVNLSWGLRGS